MTKSCVVSTSAKRRSSDTPRHGIASFDQCVTQWMSTSMSCRPRARKESQSHRWTAPSSVVMLNVHSDLETIGVGPADRTGQSSTRVWPGGSRGSRSRDRPVKPLVTKDNAASSLSGSVSRRQLDGKPGRQLYPQQVQSEQECEEQADAAADATNNGQVQPFQQRPTKKCTQRRHHGQGQERADPDAQPLAAPRHEPRRRQL